MEAIIVWVIRIMVVAAQCGGVGVGVGAFHILRITIWVGTKHILIKWECTHPMLSLFLLVLTFHHLFYRTHHHRILCHHLRLQLNLHRHPLHHLLLPPHLPLHLEVAAPTK